MKRILALVAGGLGLGALLRRRRRAAGGYELGPSPADDLRAKLAEARDRVGRRASAAEASQRGHAEAEDPDARRRSVHDRAREAIDELG